MLIVMAGLPAAGKSTIAEVVGNRLGIPVLSVDPIEAAILRAGIGADQPTGLAAYLVAEAFADTVTAGGGSIIIDAVNAVTPAREQWLNVAERREAEVRFIHVICSDPELHEQRLAARAARVAEASPTEAFAVEQSLAEWEEWTGPSGAIARITLDSVEPLGVNVERAIAFLQR